VSYEKNRTKRRLSENNFVFREYEIERSPEKNLLADAKRIQ